MRFHLACIASVLVALVCPSFAQFRRAPVRISEDGRRALNSETDVLGQEVLSQGEPSFAKVARYFPPMLQTRVPISVKDHPDEFIVSFDGALLLKGSDEIDFRVGDPPNPYGADSDFRQSLLDGYLPVPQIRWTFDGLSYEETAFGYSKDFSPDQPLLAYVRFRINNPSSRPRTARVTIEIAPSSRPGPNPSQSAEVAAHGHADLYFIIPYDVDWAKVAEVGDAGTFNDKFG